MHVRNILFALILFYSMAASADTWEEAKKTCGSSWIVPGGMAAIVALPFTLLATTCCMGSAQCQIRRRPFLLLDDQPLPQVGGAIGVLIVAGMLKIFAGVAQLYAATQVHETVHQDLTADGSDD